MTSEATGCAACGAVMADAAKHQRWHDELAGTAARVDEAQATADDALDRAEQAQNVLYQNNISV